MISTPAGPATVQQHGARIRLEHVTKNFGPTAPAVDDVSLTIEPGEFMTLLGPSGSGKTTTLNLIAGFEGLTAGRIEINAADIGKLPPHKRNLGMLFQNYALFPHLTVAQNIAYPLRERRMPKTQIAQKVADVLELVQLTGRDDHYPTQLSGGQQQRVALARAIVFDPNALLLDEPLSALDRNLRGALQREIRRIHREVGTTFVFVTHDQEEAMNLSDRIALFHDGRIEQVGSPQQLYGEPETLFAARFLGDSNVFTLDHGNPSAEVVWQGNRWHVDAATIARHPGISERAAIVIRPENIAVARAGASIPAGSNSVSATVLDIEYMGSYRTLTLSVEDHRTRVRTAADDSSTSVGDGVVAYWSPQRQRIVACT